MIIGEDIAGTLSADFRGINPIILDCLAVGVCMQGPRLARGVGAMPRFGLDGERLSLKMA